MDHSVLLPICATAVWLRYAQTHCGDVLLHCGLERRAISTVSKLTVVTTKRHMEFKWSLVTRQDHWLAEGHQYQAFGVGLGFDGRLGAFAAAFGATTAIFAFALER